MKTYYYQKQSRLTARLLTRITGIILSLAGLAIVGYIFTPLIIWQVTLAPAFAQEQVEIPIPQKTLVTPMTIKTLVASGLNSLSGVDYNNAQNWFPSYHFQSSDQRDTSYFLSIPKLAITNAFVSTIDMNLANHLVGLSSTALPPEKGNAVIFGHSTLPQLFNPSDYKTIFANAYKLESGDIIQTVVNNVTYTYKIFSITVVDPDDTSVLSQQYDDSYLTLITCTPPGTIWKRLIIKARLQKLQ